MCKQKRDSRYWEKNISNIKENTKYNICIVEKYNSFEKEVTREEKGSKIPIYSEM